MAGLDLAVHHKAALGDRAEPDLMVALALTFETAVVREKELLDLRGIR
jgi:hypothetical protein